MKKIILSIILFVSTYTISQGHIDHYKNYNYLEYELFRNNKLIGYHKYNFKRDGTNLIIDNEVSFKQVGDNSLLPEVLQRKLSQMEAITSENAGLKLTLAIGYGSQQDIIRAVKFLIDDIDNGKIEKNEIDEAKFSKYLFNFSIVP